MRLCVRLVKYKIKIKSVSKKEVSACVRLVKYNYFYFSGDELETAAGVFYVVPAQKYEYTAAVASREEAPFFGIWFCGGFGVDDERGRAIAALGKRAFRKSHGKGDKKICSAEDTTDTTDTRDKTDW